MISCLIFDLDGTLFDQKDADAKAYSIAFAEAGVNFDEKQHKKLHGLRFEERMQIMAGSMDETTKSKIKDLKVKHYKSTFDLIKPNIGLVEFIKSDKAYKKALVTTARRRNAMNLLSHFNLDPKLFDVIITGEDVSRGKPDPECYLLALKALKISPDESLVFEDSESGVKAAKSAGIKVIKVQI